MQIRYLYFVSQRVQLIDYCVINLIRSTQQLQRWQRNMMSSDSIPRKYLYILFVIAIIALCFAIILFILLTVFDYIGFNSGTPVSSISCTQTYFTTKYAQITILIKVSYLCNIISLISFSVVLVLMIKTILRAIKSEQPYIFVPKCAKITIYILTCIAILASIPTLGYYLNFLVQLPGCTSYDNTKIGLIFAFGIALTSLLIVFLILLFVFLDQYVDQNYGQVERASTEPIEPAYQPKYKNKKYLQKEQPAKKQPEVYERSTPQEISRNSPPKKIGNNSQQMEHTKQNLYNSPSRQPAVNIYSKHVDPYTNNAPQRKYTPSKEPPPVLQPRTYKKQPFMSGNSRQLPPSKEGELIYSKRRKESNSDDNEDFNKEQSRFMSNYGGRPILAASGMQDTSRQKRKAADYFRREDQPLPRKNIANSPARKGRQGNLLNYIRGKYAD